MNTLEEKKLLMSEYVEREKFLNDELTAHAAELRDLMAKKNALSEEIQDLAKLESK
jgi:hypothetical protein